MTEFDPPDLDAYNAKFQANYKVTGFGIDNIRISTPCPFCAEPGCTENGILDSEAVMARGATCARCGRGFRAVFKHEPGVTQFHIVQTVGDDAPEYLRSIFPRDPMAVQQ